jgi:two-component system, OmpR family, response regulator
MTTHAARTTTVAVVDDDRDIRDLLTRLLLQNGFAVVAVGDPSELSAHLERDEIALIVLDLMLPGKDGFEWCREFREQGGELPIVMLTARDEEVDRVVGLELGADDYVTKPFSGRELVARIKAVLRRYGAGGIRRLRSAEYAFRNWRFRPAQMELVDDQDVAVALSSRETELLLVFVRHPQTTLGRDALLDMTKGRTAYPFDRSIDTQVSRLRRKLRDEGKRPHLIKTVWGRGYMFTAPVEAR